MERQLALVQWGLPFFLTAIVIVYDVNEHLLNKREPLTSENLIGEVFFFGVLGPAAVWVVLQWLRREWIAREQARQRLEETYATLKRTQERLHVLHRQRGELLDRLLHVQEEERRRIARDIHDEFGQLLTGMSLHLQLCQDALPHDVAKARDHLAQAKSLVQSSMDHLHAIVAQLRPLVLDDLGLVAAVEDEIRERLQPAGLEVEMETLGCDKRLSATVETTVFRIVQEAFSNILRHARASHVRVRLECGREHLRVLVEDDGVGVPPYILERPSFGILGMRERVILLGGQLCVRPRTPRGTVVEAIIPLQGNSV